MFKDVVIVSGARTPVGSLGGSLKSFSTIDLGAIAIKGAMEKIGMDPNLVEEVVMGCIGQYGPNAFLARIAGVKGGCSLDSTGFTVNRLCSSGLQAIVSAAQTIDHDDAEVCVAGGAESMSNYPYMNYEARWGARMGNKVFEDSLVTALCDPFHNYHMGITAENVAAQYNVSREDQDAYAYRSNQRALAAIEKGLFKDEIIPIEVKERKGTRIFDTDEHPKNTPLQKFASLKPAFKKDGVVTAANASGVNDAGAAVVMMTGAKAKALGYKPMGRVVDYAVAGVDPAVMGIGPIYSTRKLFKKTGIKLEDIGLIELNEAFASQTLACIRELGLNEDIVNVNGSGISLGHPTGATGCIITIKLLNEMRRRNVRYGLATLCIGGGQGMSVLFERI